MRTSKLRGAFLLSLMLAVCGLLTACGLTSASGTAGGTDSTSGTTVVTAGTQGTLHPLTTATTTPSASKASTAVPGAVRLMLDKTSYTAGSPVMVTIENGLGTKIAVTDHHTNCTYVQLEQLVVGTWKPVALCKLMTPTRLVDLAPGSITPQKIGLPAGSGAAGTYRVALTYNSSTAYSATFTVA